MRSDLFFKKDIHAYKVPSLQLHLGNSSKYDFQTIYQNMSFYVATTLVWGFQSKDFYKKFRKIAKYLHHFAMGSKLYRRMLGFFHFHDSFVAKFVT
jgi:hypothetical protein